MSAGDIDFKRLREELTTLLQDEHPELQTLVVYLCFTECSTYDITDTVARPSFSDEQLLKLHKDSLGPMCELYHKFTHDFPELSKADFWTLAATISIKLLGGPSDIKWRAGRKDGIATGIARHSRAISPKEGAAQLRQDFKRLGFSDEEGVALCRALTLGGLFLPTVGFERRLMTENEKNEKFKFDNGYYRELLEKTWVGEKTKQGELKEEREYKQYRDANNKDIVRLPCDIALLKDPSFHGYVEKFAKSADEWKEKFTSSFEKLIDMGHHELQQADKHTTTTTTTTTNKAQPIQHVQDTTPSAAAATTKQSSEV